MCSLKVFKELDEARQRADLGVICEGRSCQALGRARPRDALSTTTQATHLSSRSTTPTEVSEVLSRSSSNDSLYVDSAAAFDENT
eukprot:s2351_g9.t1